MEPEALRQGKQFHQQVQRDWRDSVTQGRIQPEHTVRLLLTSAATRIRRGRIDILVDELSDFVAIVEIKGTDWDRIRPGNIQRNLAAHRRQVWKYIEKYVDGDRVDVFAGIIYPSAPVQAGLRQRIEDYLNDYGLQVVWYYD